MRKVRADFAVETKNGVVTNVGKSVVTMPKTNFKGGNIKWFDDSKLYKKPKSK